MRLGGLWIESTSICRICSTIDATVATRLQARWVTAAGGQRNHDQTVTKHVNVAQSYNKNAWDPSSFLLVLLCWFQSEVYGAAC